MYQQLEGGHQSTRKSKETSLHWEISKMVCLYGRGTSGKSQRVAEKCDIRTQVRKPENRPMSQVNYQATYKSLLVYILEMVLWIWPCPDKKQQTKGNAILEENAVGGTHMIFSFCFSFQMSYIFVIMLLVWLRWDWVKELKIEDRTAADPASLFSPCQPTVLPFPLNQQERIALKTTQRGAFLFYSRESATWRLLQAFAALGYRCTPPRPRPGPWEKAFPSNPLRVTIVGFWL